MFYVYQLTILSLSLSISLFCTGVPHWADAIKKWTNLNAVEYSGSYLSCALARDTEFYYQDSEGNNIPDLYKFDVVVASYRSVSHFYWIHMLSIIGFNLSLAGT
jgi:hypothetical protein